MKPEIKARWANALRSKLYPQGKHHLQEDGKFCCLGVLCELAAQDGVVDKWIDSTGLTSYGGETDTLPEAVIRWSGMPDETGTTTAERYDPETIGRKFSSLVEFNDDLGMDFDEIANIIEREY